MLLTFVKINGINIYYRSNIMAEKDKIYLKIKKVQYKGRETSSY